MNALREMDLMVGMIENYAKDICWNVSTGSATFEEKEEFVRPLSRIVDLAHQIVRLAAGMDKEADE